MRRFKCPDRLVRLLGLTLGLSVSAALSAGQAATCDLPEQLISVSVNGASRGVQVLRLQSSDDGEVQVLLPEELLRPSELPLRGERFNCDGQLLFAPAVGVRVRFNQAEQQLNLSLPAKQLGGRDFDLQGNRPSEIASQPSWGVAFGVNVQAAAPGWNNLTLNAAEAYLGAGYVKNRLSGYADVFVARDLQGALRYQPRGLVRYALNPTTVVSAAWNADPNINTPEFNETDFRGFSIEGQMGFQRLAPQWVLELPLDAEVTVLLDGTVLGSAEVSAGSLSVRNVRVDKAGVHALKAIISDDTGVREETLNLTEETFSLPRGALVYSARAGMQRGLWQGSGQAEYGLTRNLSVKGSVFANSEVQSLTLGAAYAQTRWNGEFGVRYRRTPANSQLDATARARLYLGDWQLSGLLVVPTQDFSAGMLTLNAMYHTRNWFMNASYAQGFTGTDWSLGASVSHTFNNRLSGSVYGGIGSTGWQIGVQVGYLFNSQLQTSLGGQTSSAGSSGSLNVVYKPAPAHTFDLDVNTPLSGALRYRYSRAVDAQFSMSSSGMLQGYARGAINFTGGQTRLQPALAQRAILIRTGVPNLKLLINNQQEVVTDSAGDALVVNVSGGQVAEVSVNLSALPITISVQSERQRITPPLLGLYTLDWRQNFTMSRWVQFSWTNTELAADADFVTPQGKFPLDDQGNGLLPASAAPISGTLRTQDGTRTCTVVLAPAAEKATCQTVP